MSPSTKVLIIIIAVAAFAIGVTVNSASVSDEINVDALLSAKLLNKDEEIETISTKLGEITLINFWASWCAPCRHEMPIFETMFRQSKSEGFQVIGIAIDSPDKTQAMLDSMDISYPILYAEQTGMELMELTGNPQGLLPYSLLIDKNGVVLQQVLGRISADDIASWIDEYL